MPIGGPAAPRTAQKPSWMRESASPSNTTLNSKRKDSSEGSSASSSDAKGEGTPPRRPSKVTMIPKANGNNKTDSKLQSREIKVPVAITKKTPTQPVASKDSGSSKSSSLASTDKSRSPSTAASDKSRSPSKAATPPKRTVKEKTPDSDDFDLDSSEYEEITVTETESEEDEIQRPVKFVPLRKVSKADVKEKSATPEPEFVKPQLRKVEKQPSLDKREREHSPEHKFVKPQLRKVKRDPSKKEIPKEKLPQVQLKKAPPKEERELRREPTIPSIQEIKKENINKIPPPPPPPPKVPPPPNFKKEPIKESAKAKLEQLKKRPRKRPDWFDMMKEVEEGKKLRHVECNDRSHPIINCKSVTKVQGQFIFETEKATKLDALLKEIQGGIRLKPTKCNDRSKPQLESLRKIKRQMTVEEQIMKSESKAQLDSMPPSVMDSGSEDEVNDIDKLRDDLQSTKQLLALELRNKEAQERENKRLMSRIQNLEAELERERQNKGGSTGGSGAVTKAFADDDPLVKALKKESEEAQKQSKMLEKKYADAAEKLDIAKAELEEQKKLIAKFMAQEGVQMPRKLSRQPSEHKEKEETPEPTLSSSEDEDADDDDEEKKRAKALRRLTREIKLLRFRLDKYKEKEAVAKKERQDLKEQMKNNQKMLKDEKKKYRKLQKEVEKMSTMMLDEGDEDEDGEEKTEKPDQPAEDEETESEEESEESEDEPSEPEWSDSENEDAPESRKKKNLEPRVKKHENRLSTLKKGNLILEANVIRLKDEINKQRELCSALQADLDSLINDL